MSLSCFFCSSDICIRRLNRLASTTTPSSPAGSSSESFFTSSPARPKIACSSFSSGLSSLLDFGLTLPTRMSPGPTARADLHDAVLVEVASAPSPRRSGCPA